MMTSVQIPFGRSKKVLGQQRYVPAAGLRHDDLLALGRNQATGPAPVLGVGPPADTGLIPPGHFRHSAKPATNIDDRSCRFHAQIIATIATSVKAASCDFRAYSPR